MAEANDFSFNAPTYFDFDQQKVNEEAENVEKYFEIDHENESQLSTITIEDSNTPPPIHTEGSSDSENDYGNDTTLPLNPQNRNNDLGQHRLKKSMSTGDILQLRNFTSEEKRKGSSKPNLTTRLNNLALPKKSSQQKYVSTAEQVTKFYGTPDRFHTRQKNFEMRLKGFKMMPLTVPQSPALATKTRHRTTRVLSREETEKLELDERKKFKIKAQPLNQKILQGPVKAGTIPKKSCTIVRPFNLTEHQPKKIEEIPQPQYEFHARPMPKAIYASSVSDGPVQNKPVPRSVSHDNLKIKPRQPASVEKPKKPTQLTRTEPAPFSFAARDERIAQRKEQLISKVLEQEKQAREFRAKPPPKYLYKRSTSLTSIRSNGGRNEDEKKDAGPIFKAKEPTVLYQKPFEPKKSDRALTEVTEFCLNTDRRVRERGEFDIRLKEKQDRTAMLIQMKEEERIRQEEAEIIRLRKEAVHSAQPIRHFKELKIVASMKVTVPMSPNFKTAQRADKEN